MRLKTIITCLTLVVVILQAVAQTTFVARVDTVVMLIGQPRELTLEVACPRDKSVQLPAFEQYQPLFGGIEIVDPLGTDTTLLLL